jgi:hypothetical protein
MKISPSCCIELPNRAVAKAFDEKNSPTRIDAEVEIFCVCITLLEV